MEGLFVEPLSREVIGFEGFSSKANMFELVVVCFFVLKALFVRAFLSKLLAWMDCSLGPSSLEAFGFEVFFAKACMFEQVMFFPFALNGTIYHEISKPHH